MRVIIMMPHATAVASRPYIPPVDLGSRRTDATDAHAAREPARRRPRGQAGATVTPAGGGPGPVLLRPGPSAPRAQLPAGRGAAAAAATGTRCQWRDSDPSLGWRAAGCPAGRPGRGRGPEVSPDRGNATGLRHEKPRPTPARKRKPPGLKLNPGPTPSPSRNFHSAQHAHWQAAIPSHSGIGTSILCNQGELPVGVSSIEGTTGPRRLHSCAATK